MLKESGDGCLFFEAYMLPLCFWFSKVFQYLPTENLRTENLRLSFVFAFKQVTFTQKAEEEFLLYNTLIIIYSDFH